MPSGGKREGAGRKTGTKLLITHQKEKVLAELRNRVMANADKLFNAQFSKAVGSIMVFERVETPTKKGEPKVEHVLVTDPDRIKDVLDRGEGVNCATDDGFFIVTTVPPDNRAIDSMLDRTFGKAPQSIEVTTDHSPVEVARELYNILIGEEKLSPEKAADAVAKRYNIEPEVLLTSEAVN